VCSSDLLKKRFQSYVDPKIVDYVLANPGQATFAGQQREMTVVFTDLAGFTTIAEKLGPRTVELLNEYFGLMVPIIRANRGILNKFLGDGMMFFFNAPVAPNTSHARDAVATVLQMQHAVTAFNQRLIERGLPPVKMRAGITTGTMVAGDAGSTNPTAADYTVLGDNVNLGSRLEAANKAVGTGALVTERTYDLSRDGGILCRPVGKLGVVEKSTGVMTYEPMALRDDATERQKELASATKVVVDSFMAGSLAECVEAIALMEAAHGRSKLTDLYLTVRVVPARPFTRTLRLPDRVDREMTRWIGRHGY